MIAGGRCRKLAGERFTWSPGRVSCLFGASSVLWLGVALVVVGCQRRASESTGIEEPAAVISFTDVSEVAGLRFTHDNGASPRRYLPETMGSGVAFFDYDGDGRPDLYFANAGPIEAADGALVGGALYRNLGDGTFVEVTRHVGLEQPFYGLGTAVGDVDNDGDLDLFVSGLEGDRLYVNSGDGRFEDGTSTAGLAGAGFGSSAAFLDFDNDGWLDLFVGRYVTWSADADVLCSPDGEHRSYCTPEIYPGISNQLYRNLGEGRFVEVTGAAGLEMGAGKTLGVVPIDHDGDGWADLAIANDTYRNFLFINQRDGTFVEDAVVTGMAYSLSGATRGAMGIDAGDLDGDGREELVIGNFSQEMSAIYRAGERGLYSDDAAQLGLGLPTLMTLAFGTLVIDLDLDGWLDVVFANGHIEPDVKRFQPLQTHAQPLSVFRSLEGRKLQPVQALGAAAGPWVGRGLAAADYDGDGDLDLVLTQNGGRARLLRNDSPPRSWLRLRLVGRGSNRTAYGAVATVFVGQRRIRRRLVSGRSYLSASEPLLSFGLGSAEWVDRVEIRWPSGQLQVLDRPPLGEVIEVEEEE